MLNSWLVMSWLSSSVHWLLPLIEHTLTRAGKKYFGLVWFLFVNIILSLLLMPSNVPSTAANMTFDMLVWNWSSWYWLQHSWVAKIFPFLALKRVTCFLDFLFKAAPCIQSKSNREAYTIFDQLQYFTTPYFSLPCHTCSLLNNQQKFSGDFSCKTLSQ